MSTQPPRILYLRPPNGGRVFPLGQAMEVADQLNTDDPTRSYRVQVLRTDRLGQDRGKISVYDENEEFLGYL